MSKKAKIEFHRRLIESISNERRTFNMTLWVRGVNQNKLATCGTASCMAGHIEALEQKLAKQLTPEFMDYSGCIDHANLARAIYKKVTGEPCLLDFYAFNTNIDVFRDDLSRGHAIKHIRGTNKSWPQFTKEPGW